MSRLFRGVAAPARRNALIEESTLHWVARQGKRGQEVLTRGIPIPAPQLESVHAELASRIQSVTRLLGGYLVYLERQLTPEGNVKQA